jgi:Predicted membrane protein (DUF2335)
MPFPATLQSLTLASCGLPSCGWSASAARCHRRKFWPATNEVLPGGAERIVALAEDQARHRRHMEARGQILLFTVALVALIGGIGLIAIGKGAAGLVPVIAAVGGLGSLFVYREVKTHRLTKQLEASDE